MQGKQGVCGVCCQAVRSLGSTKLDITFTLPREASLLLHVGGRLHCMETSGVALVDPITSPRRGGRAQCSQSASHVFLMSRNTTCLPSHALSTCLVYMKNLKHICDGTCWCVSKGGVERGTPGTGRVRNTGVKGEVRQHEGRGRGSEGFGPKSPRESVASSGPI